MGGSMESKSKTQFKPNKMTLLAILMSSMVILMGAAAIAPALEPISKAFPEHSAFVISLVITLPSLASAIAGFGMGYLADRFGKAKIYTISLAIFTVAGVAGYFTDSFYIMLAGRFILGIGIAGISLCTSALIGEYYFGQQRAKVVGYQSAAIGVGALVLEAFGGGLADMGWHEPFLVYLIGLPILILALLSVREPAKAASGTGGATEVVIPGKWRKVAVCYLVVALEMFMMFALPVNFSYYITEIGQNYLMCGILLGVMGLSQAVTSLLYSRTAHKLSEMGAYAVAFLAMGIGMLLFFINSIPVMMVGMIFVGGSLGLLMPTVIGSLAALSGPKDSGKVMGGYSVALNLANFLSALVFAAIVIPIVGSYQKTFALIGCFALVICAVIYVYGRVRSDRETATRAPPAIISQAPISADSVVMYKSILIATDGSETGMYALKSALNIARKNDATLTALYVFDPESYYAGGGYSSENAEELGRKVSSDILKQASDMADSFGVRVDTKVVFGHPANGIIEESRNHDLVVCGSIGRTNIKRALMGSVAEKVARMAYCPVLICRDYHRE